MASKPRIIVSNFIYHVSSQGTNEISVFETDDLKSFFLHQLTKTIKKYPCKCLSFSITNNQYHLVIKTGQDSISRIMQQFNSVIAKNFNRIKGRNGVVFKTRFRSVIVEDDKLKELIRFVNLEPVSKKECTIEELVSYRWSAHSGLLGNVEHQFLSTDEVLSQFNSSDSKKEYQDFIHGINSDCNSIEFLNHLIDAILGRQNYRNGESWILGKPEFVQHVLNLDECRRARIARYISDNVSIDEIQEEVTRLLCLPKEALLRQGQFDVRSTARELFVAVGKLRFDYSGAQMARHLNASQSAVSRMYTRFDSVQNKDYLINTVVEHIVSGEKRWLKGTMT